MRELRKEFNKHFGHLTQKYKDNRVVIYQVEQKHADDDGTSIWYEVFRYRVKPANRFVDDDHEVYPSDEDFGVWTWSCSNLDVVRKVLSHPTRGHFDFDHDETERIISYLVGS